MTQICLEKVQKALCNIMEEEFISLFKVVFECFAETSVTNMSQILQDHFKSEMINYLSKDLYKVLVEGCTKTGTTNVDSFLNFIFIFLEFYDILGLSLNEKLRTLEKSYLIPIHQ
ncbi:unnamed protein product [Rhizophagus irregularis]|nr:unnamed protein product [Rhizophagus irregularis]